MILGEVCNFAGSYNLSLASFGVDSTSPFLQLMPSSKQLLSSVQFRPLASKVPIRLHFPDSPRSPVRSHFRSPLVDILEGETHFLRLVGVCSVCRKSCLGLNRASFHPIPSSGPSSLLSMVPRKAPLARYASFRNYSLLQGLWYLGAS